MSEWKPIETAPKDGSWIIAWRGECPFEGAWDNPVYVTWHEFDGDNPAWVWPSSFYEVYSDLGRAKAENLIIRGNFFEADDEFTHWMPLLEPPA